MRFNYKIFLLPEKDSFTISELYLHIIEMIISLDPNSIQSHRIRLLLATRISNYLKFVDESQLEVELDKLMFKLDDVDIDTIKQIINLLEPISYNYLVMRLMKVLAMKANIENPKIIRQNHYDEIGKYKTTNFIWVVLLEIQKLEYDSELVNIIKKNDESVIISYLRNVVGVKNYGLYDIENILYLSIKNCADKIFEYYYNILFVYEDFYLLKFQLYVYSLLYGSADFEEILAQEIDDETTLYEESLDFNV